MTYLESQSYLINERKLLPSTIQEYNIAFYDRKGYLFAGTSYPKEFTQLSEFYADSLIFPIYDLYGECVGIQTRRMYPSKNKYVNSANSNIFTKGRHLYGLDKSYKDILEQNQVIVTEGLFDSIQLRQQGIKNVVSIMGTALSDTQAALLSRFTNNVVLLLDPDPAGERASNKHLRKLEKHLNCKQVHIPTKQDPDEFIIQEGVDKFKQLIQGAITL